MKPNLKKHWKSALTAGATAFAVGKAIYGGIQWIDQWSEKEKQGQFTRLEFLKEKEWMFNAIQLWYHATSKKQNVLPQSLVDAYVGNTGVYVPLTPSKITWKGIEVTVQGIKTGPEITQINICVKTQDRSVVMELWRDIADNYRAVLSKKKRRKLYLVWGMGRRPISPSKVTSNTTRQNLRGNPTRNKMVP